MFFTAFLLGLAGSLHCVAMCGPLIFALPLDRRTRLAGAADLLSYQTGRILTYAALGFVFGIVGQAATVAGFQKWMTVSAGLGLLSAAFFSIKKIENGLLNGLPSLSRLFSFVKNGISKRLASRSFFVIGLLNGLIPCGLVYAAIAGSMAVGSAVSGAIFMLIFGLATWPLTFVVGLGGSFFKTQFRKMTWLQTTLLAVAGSWMIWRALAIELTGLFAEKIPMCH